MRRSVHIFDWAIEEAIKKKKQDFSRVEFLTYDEGLCVQCMHIGSYDNEPVTVELMHEHMKENGYELDITDNRFHHEIYLSDPRKCDFKKWFFGHYHENQYILIYENIEPLEYGKEYV